MEVKILREEENNLFNRTEVKFEVIHDGEATPKLADVRVAVATKTGSQPSLVIIDGFKTLFGVGRTVGDARIYKDMKDLKEYEPNYLLIRNGLIERPPEKEKVKEKPKAGDKGGE